MHKCKYLLACFAVIKNLDQKHLIRNIYVVSITSITIGTVQGGGGFSPPTPTFLSNQEIFKKLQSLAKLSLPRLLVNLAQDNIRLGLEN